MGEKQSQGISVDDSILAVLKESREPLSTYELAKRLGVSWSTVNTHCYKLKDAGKIECTQILPKIGAGKKVVWFVKEYESLAKFSSGAPASEAGAKLQDGEKK